MNCTQIVVHAALTALLVGVGGCGAGEESRRLTEQLNQLSDRRAAQTIIEQAPLDSIIFHCGQARSALDAGDLEAYQREVTALRDLGDVAVENLAGVASGQRELAFGFPELHGTRQSEDADRLLAIRILGDFGPRAAAAVPALENIEQDVDEDGGIRDAARQSLRNVQ